jgi:hypothetical protein
MFKTIFTVTKKVYDSTKYSAYFENYHEAFVFAKKEVIKANDNKLVGILPTKRNYLDGSFLLTWDLDNVEIFMHDNAWITDFRVNGIGFYDEHGLLTEFENMDIMREYFKNSQKIAVS